MITLITGVPGMGKTAMLVHMLLKNDRAYDTARPVFVMGINGLLIDHVRVPPIEEWTQKRPDPDDPKVLLDYYTFPPNSYLVVDECQRVFRPRNSASAVPPIVAALETHRHTGLDIILLTQKPNLVDSNVRALVGRHIHIRTNVLGARYLYEWPEYRDVTSPENLKEAAKRKYAPPKEVFGLYKSAELHTKQPRRFHQAFVYLALAVVFAGYFAVRSYNNIFGKVKHENIENSQLVEKGGAADKVGQAGSQTLQRGPAMDGQRSADSAQTYSGPDPAFNVSNDLHPYSGFTFVLVGVVKGKNRDLSYYRLFNGEYGFTATSDELKELGYSIKVVNHCTSYLIYEKAKIVAICALHQDPPTVQASAEVTKEPEGDIRGRQPLNAEPITLDSKSWDTYRAPSPLSKY